ncbi:MAG: 2-phospho-L-lactate transferase [Promethearchaeota archaeon]
MSEDIYVVLAGGVGAAKLIKGLINVIDQEKLKIIVNTGDDIELFGLQICPDLDIITYTIAGVVDEEKGWGFKDETFNCLSILEKYYGFRWFNAGDKDLATHVYRTDLFKQGLTKAEITKKICEKLGVKAEIIPMCNESVSTYIKTPQKTMHFEEFFIKEQCCPEILKVEYRGIENAKPVKKVLKYIEQAKKIIICPSNPIVSIGTILAVKGIKDKLIEFKEKVYAISPIVEGTPVKGPADKLMKCFGLDVSCIGIAEFYKEFLGTLIIDIRDKDSADEIKKLGINVYYFDTIMTNLKKKIELARFIIEL